MLWAASDSEVEKLSSTFDNLRGLWGKKRSLRLDKREALVNPPYFEMRHHYKYKGKYKKHKKESEVMIFIVN